LRCRLGSDLQPAIRAFLYIRIVPFGISAIVPIIGRLLHGRWRGFLLLDIDWRRHRHRNHWRIGVIRGIIRPRETISAVTIATIIPAIATPITQAKSIPAKAIAGIIAAYSIECRNTKMTVPAVMVMTAMMVMPAVMMVTTVAMIPTPVVPTAAAIASSAPVTTSTSVTASTALALLC
jgi:hypothetical protein